MKNWKQQQVEFYLPSSPTNTDETFPDDQSLDEEQQDAIVVVVAVREEKEEEGKEEQGNDPLAAQSELKDETPTARKYKRFQHWKEHGYAVGLAPITWSDDMEDEETSGPYDSIRMHSELSRIFCRMFGRVGNMVILKERKNWVRIPTLYDDGPSSSDGSGSGSGRVCTTTSTTITTTATSTTRTSMVDTRSTFRLVVGPYWPMLLFFTLPLITIFTIVVAWCFIYKYPPSWFHFSSSPMGIISWIILAIWTIATMGLYSSLLYTSLVDPGILPRFTERPASDWRWNDQVQSYIPPRAVYEPDCKVVIDEYHHTCIFTGTAIGTNNVKSFFYFIFFAMLHFVLDIFLMISSIIH
mmetsp:Transcript_4821/g.9195  ORF Transcript_4821/g.9195 Transcript_4821/m.9195 type:complete len:354 (-) Transcript_4821:72-1133(-)